MARRRARGALAVEQLGELAEASLRNASRLIAEARVLLARGDHARAYSLSVIAAEEFGKCQLAIGTVGRDLGSDESYWREWWSAFYLHDAKLIRFAVASADLLPEDYAAQFVDLFDGAWRQRRRQAGLYVDVVDTTVVSPASAISVSEAEAALACFGHAIEVYDESYEPGELAAALNEAHVGEGQRMRAAIESRDRDEIRKVWAETTGRVLSEEELDEWGFPAGAGPD